MRNRKTTGKEIRDSVERGQTSGRDDAPAASKAAGDRRTMRLTSGRVITVKENGVFTIKRHRYTVVRRGMDVCVKSLGSGCFKR